MLVTLVELVPCQTLQMLQPYAFPTRWTCFCHKADIANFMVEQSFAIPAPYIQGGFTDLLHGVQQEAAMSSSARKLYFDDNM